MTGALITTVERAGFAKELARPEWRKELDTHPILSRCEQLGHPLQIKTLHGTKDDSRLGDSTISCHVCNVNAIAKMPEKSKATLRKQRLLWDATNHRISDRRKARERTSHSQTLVTTRPATPLSQPYRSPTPRNTDEILMIVYMDECSAPDEFYIQLHQGCVIPASLPRFNCRLKMYLPTMALFVPFKPNTAFYVYGSFLLCHSITVNFRDCRKVNDRVRELHESLPFSMPIPMFLDSFDAALTSTGVFGGR